MQKSYTFDIYIRFYGIKIYIRLRSDLILDFKDTVKACFC